MRNNKLHKSMLAITTLGVVLASLVGLSQTERASALVDTPWGPERKTYTWEDPAPYATFNSITNNPQLGDERNFVRVREVADGNSFVDEVTVEPGKTYEVYIYYHNNADAHEVGKTAIGIADNVKMKSSFPAKVTGGERATVTGTITAADTDPLSVWDGAYLNPTQDLYLRYIPGTATIHNGGTLNGQPIGPDYLFGDGATLGYNKFSGILPGCNEYAGFVTYQIFADAPGFDISKSVVGDNTTVNPGDIVTFKVSYKNTGTMDQANVVIRDTLPDSLQYVTGSSKLYNNNNPDGVVVNDDIVNENGMNIGNYAGGSGWADVTYQVLVKDDVKCGDVITNNVTVSTNDGNKHASLSLTVKGDCDPVPEDCTTNPNLPGCKKDCTTNPELPECQTIPDTGPVEIVLAIIIVLGLCGAGFYFWRTHKKVKAVENKVSGKSEPKSEPEKTEDKAKENAPKKDTPKPEDKTPEQK